MNYWVHLTRSFPCGIRWELPSNSCCLGGFLELLSSGDMNYNIIYSSMAPNNSQVITGNAEMQVRPNNQTMNLPRPFPLQELPGPPPLALEALSGNALICYQKTDLSSNSLVSAALLLWDVQNLNLAFQLLCDEATSALDNTTEAEILTALKFLSSNQTSIFIDHRLTTAMQCDEEKIEMRKDKMCLEEPLEGRRRSSRIKALEEKRKKERQALAEARKKKAITLNEIRESNNRNKGKKKVSFVDDNDDYWDLFDEEYDHFHNSNIQTKTRKSMSSEYLISKTKPIQRGQNIETSTSEQTRRTTELQRRYTYRPPNGKDCLFSQVLNSPQQLIQLEEFNPDSYRESMIQFVHGLNGKVQSFASKKLESFNMRDHMIIANPNPERQYHHFSENQINLQQRISQLETAPLMDPPMHSSPSPLLSNSTPRIPGCLAVQEAARNVSAINEAQLLPSGLVPSALSIPGADLVACQARNMTIIDESQFFPPVQLLSNKALSIPGTDADSSQSRNMIANDGSYKLNDKGKSKMVYEDKNSKACAAAILANIFLRYDKNGSISGTKGESLNNASMAGSLLLGRITNDDNTIGITGANDCKEKSNSHCFAMGEGTDDEDCEILFVTNSWTGKHNGQRGMADAVDCQVRNDIDIDKAQFLPPVLSNKVLSIPGANAVACQARNVTVIDEPQFFPPASLLSDKALSIPGANPVSSRSRKVTTINGGFGVNDKGESEVVYEDKNWKAYAAAILGSIFLKHEKNGSSNGTKGESSKNASMTGSLLPAEIVNNDNAFGICRGSHCKKTSNNNAFAPDKKTNDDDDDCQRLFSTNWVTVKNNGQRRMPAEVMEPSSYIADMPQRTDQALTQVWPTRVISGPQPKPLEAIAGNTFTGSVSFPRPRTRPLEVLDSSMKTPAVFSSQRGIVNESMINSNIHTKAVPSQDVYFPPSGLRQSGSDNSCQPGGFHELLESFEKNIPTWGNIEASLGCSSNSYRPGGFLELLSSDDMNFNSIYSSMALNNNQVMTTNADMQVQPNNPIMNPPRLLPLQEPPGVPLLMAPEVLSSNALTYYEKAALSSDSLVSAAGLLWDDEMPNLDLQL